MRKLEDSEKGFLWRKAANGITWGKTGLAAGIAINTVTGDRLLPKAFRHRSYGSAALTALYGFLDKADGYCGRKAEAYGVPITKREKELDPKLDKLGNKLLMGSIAVRGFYDFATGETLENRLLGMVVGVGASRVLAKTEDRDARMNESRENAVEGADTSAVTISKYKTGAQNLGHFLLELPQAAQPEIAAVGLGVYELSLELGEEGLRQADAIHRGLVTS